MTTTMEKMIGLLGGDSRSLVRGAQAPSMLDARSVKTELMRVQQMASESWGPPAGPSPLAPAFRVGGEQVLDETLEGFVPMVNKGWVWAEASDRRAITCHVAYSDVMYPMLLELGAKIVESRVLTLGQSTEWPAAVVAVCLVNVLLMAGFKLDNEEFDVDRSIAVALATPKHSLTVSRARLLGKRATPPIFTPRVSV